MPVDKSFHRSAYQGRDPNLAAAAWKCPSCGQNNTTVLEEGCPGCGAGTAAEVEAARLRKQEGLPSFEELAMFLLKPGVRDIDERIRRLEGLSDRARLTVARALAAYAQTVAEHPPTELTRAQALGWARALIEE